MIVAVFSDIHANPWALEAVLEDARQKGAKKLICLGDVVGYGPLAEETIALLRKEEIVCLMGNHDAAVSAMITGENFNLTALQGVRRHRDETSVASRQWLAKLQYTYTFEDKESGFACAHGEFSNPMAFRYVMKPTDAIASFHVRHESLLFVGHTHAAGVVVYKEENGDLSGDGPSDEGLKIEAGVRYIVNVGSVGYPRRDKESIYCLYDTERKVVEWRKLPFNYRRYEKAMKAKDIALPSWWSKQRVEQFNLIKWMQTEINKIIKPHH